MERPSSSKTPQPEACCFEFCLSSRKVAKSLHMLLSKLLPKQCQAQKQAKWADRVYHVRFPMAEDWMLEVSFCAQSIWLTFQHSWYVRGELP